MMLRARVAWRAPQEQGAGAELLRQVVGRAGARGRVYVATRPESVPCQRRINALRESIASSLLTLKPFCEESSYNLQYYKRKIIIFNPAAIYQM